MLPYNLYQFILCFTELFPIYIHIQELLQVVVSLFSIIYPPYFGSVAVLTNCRRFGVAVLTIDLSELLILSHSFTILQCHDKIHIYNLDVKSVYGQWP